MGLPARNPELLVIQFGGRVGGRTHPTPRLGRLRCLLRAIVLSAQQLRQLGEVRRHAAVAERRTPTVCPELMLWAAPPPARECHGYGRR